MSSSVNADVGKLKRIVSCKAIAGRQLPGGTTNHVADLDGDDTAIWERKFSVLKGSGKNGKGLIYLKVEPAYIE